MVPGSLELWFVVLLAVVLSVPVLLALLAFVNRADDDREAELEELRRRVEELESERE